MPAKPDLKVSVEPTKVGFKAPNDGAITGIVRVKILNTLKDRVVFEIKLTNPDRFAVAPPYGFVEPSSYFLIKIKPKAFDLSKLPPTEHFTVLVAKAPPDITDAAQVWKKGSALQPQETKRFVVNVIYCKGTMTLPPVIADPRAGKPAAVKTAKKPAPGKKEEESGNKEDDSKESEETDGTDEESSEASDLSDE